MAFAAQPAWVSEVRCAVGESPVWDIDAQALYWMDIASPGVYSLKDGTVRHYPFGKPIGSIYLATQGRLLLALRKGLAWLDLASGVFTPIAFEMPGNDNNGGDERFNDGRCDAHGRIWVSTMDRKTERDIGSLVELDSSLNVVSVTPSHARIGNGVCFSPDGRFMYFSDSRGRAIYRYGKPAPGRPLGERELFAKLDDAPGRPDGCTVDAAGCLWSARVGGGRLDRYSPGGQLLGTLELPVSHPTHCAFGGKDLKTLYVTSMRFPADDPAFADQPLAGAVLAFELGVPGLPEHRFAG